MSRLYAAPLAVNGLIRTNLLAGRSAVLTSATLALGGTFVPLARAVGLERSTTAGRRTALAPPTPRAGEASPSPSAARGAVARARRRQPVRLPAPGDPLHRAAPAGPGPRADDGRPARRDRGARHRGRRPDARPVLLAPRSERRGGRPCGSGSTCPSSCQGDDQLPTLVRQFRRRPAGPACSAPCPCGRASTSRARRASSSSSTASRSRAPTTRSARPGPRRSSRRAATASSRCPRTHAALLLAQGAGPAHPEHGRPRGGRGPRPAARDRALRRLPDALVAGVLADHRPRRVVARSRGCH